MIETARQLWAKGDNIRVGGRELEGDNIRHIVCKSGKSKHAMMGAAAAAAMIPDQVWHHLEDARRDVEL